MKVWIAWTPLQLQSKLESTAAEMIALNSHLTHCLCRLDYRKRPSTMPHASYSQQMAPPQHRQRTRPCASKYLHPWEHRDRPQRQPIEGTSSRTLSVKRKITISKMRKLHSHENATHAESTLEMFHGQAPKPVLNDFVDVLSEEMRTAASSETIGKTSTQTYSCKRYVSFYI